MPKLPPCLLPPPLPAGGWYDPEERGGGGAARYAMSPAGSPPAELGSFMEHAAPEGSGWPPSPAAAQEGQGVWYGGGVEVQEEYEALQAPDEAEMATW